MSSSWKMETGKVVVFFNLDRSNIAQSWQIQYDNIWIMTLVESHISRSSPLCETNNVGNFHDEYSKQIEALDGLWMCP